MSPNEETPMTLQMGESIVVRLVQLEREQKAMRRANNILSIGLVAAVLLMIAGVTAGLVMRGRTSLLETQQIRVTDANGLLRGSLGVEGDSIGLILYDHQAGRPRLSFAVPPNGAPTITLADGRGRSRMLLSFDANGQTTFALMDGNGNARSVLALSPNSSAQLVFVDGQNQARAVLGVDESGAPMWTFIEDPGSAGTPPGGGQ